MASIGTAQPKGGEHEASTQDDSQNRSRQGLHQKSGLEARSRSRLHAQKVATWAEAHIGRLLVAYLGAVAAVRLGLVLTYDGYLGVDGGAYALGILQFFGPAGAYIETSFERPPLAPGFLYAPFWYAFDGITPLGLNLYAGVFSLSLIPFFYLLAQRLIGRKWAALATVGLTIDWPLGEMFVTGVVPITGFGMLSLTLWGIVNLAGGSTRFLHWAAVVVGIPLIAHTNQTTLGIAAVSIPIVWLMLPNKVGVMTALGMGAIGALSALPWYLDVLPGQPRVSYPGPLVYLNPWWSSQWLQAVAGIAVAVLTLKTRPAQAMRAMAVLVIVHSVLNVFLSYDEAVINIFYRSSYWLAVPFWICTAHLVRHGVSTYKPSARALAAAGAVVLAVGWYGVQDQFYGQAYYSDLAGPNVLAALESIPADEITRIGTNAESRGFYLAAITQKPVVWVQSAFPATEYVGQEAQARCALGWLDCDDRSYVSHWLIDTKHTQQIKVTIDRAPNPERPWDDLGAAAPWLEKTFERGTVQVWSLR